jgi:photosystem II stability/assembly factor-like uncharacterized protein
MKLLFFLISFFIFHSLLHAQWDVLNEGINFGSTYLTQRGDLQFISEDMGWFITADITSKTTDGGETWYPHFINGNWILKKVWSLNDTVTYSYCFSDSSDNRAIFKSEDGGFSWFLSLNFADNYNLSDLSIVNDTIVYSIGEYLEDGWIMRSEDGGANWQFVHPAYPINGTGFYKCKFYDSGKGIIVANTYSNLDSSRILRTYDGGVNWDEQISDQVIYSLQFVSDSVVYFTSLDEIYLSIDTMNTWKTLNTINHFSPFFAADEDTVYTFFGDSSENYLVKSSDRGFSWEIKKTIQGLPIQIYFTPLQTGIYIENYGGGGQTGYFDPLGRNYFLHKSNDGGDSWSLVKYNYPFTNVFFIDRENGFATGGRKGTIVHTRDYGRLFKTLDGGHSWEFIPELENRAYSGCYFVTPQIGFVWDGGVIFKTSNGGLNWPVFNSRTDSTNYTFGGNDILFLNEKTIYQVGFVEWDDDSSEAAILVSDDGGENWDLKWYYSHLEGYDNSLNSIYSTDSVIWAVGQNIIVKSVTADSFKVIEPETDLPLNEVFFSDDEHGWIRGGYSSNQEFQSILLKTSDGGKSWQKIQMPEYIINDMYFSDSLHGWAVGYDTTYTGNWPPGSGLILHTSDGGESWFSQIEGLSAPLTALDFKDGIAWAVGANGLVLRTDNWVTWTNPQTGKIYPSEHKLFQNYPNPFNPSTTIEFSLPRPEYTTLKIYNILGAEVAKPVSEILQAGLHRYQFNGSKLASGVYYYQISAGEFREVKKMILLR